MSVFDATLRAGDMGFQVNEGPDGKKIEAQLVANLVTVIPVGPNQLMPLPIGTIRIGMIKENLEGLIKAAQEAVEQLDEPSRLEIASDPRAVENAARQQQDFTSRLR